MKSARNNMHDRKGFTIIESMLASVVLATAVVGIAGALAASVQHNTSMRERGIMLQLARALAEEVASAPYTDALGGFGQGWAAGKTDRRDYDDIFDFDGYADQSPFKSIVATGVSLDYGGEYRRTVRVEPLATPSTLAASPALGKFTRVTVTVRSPSGAEIRLHRWASRVTIKR